MIDAIIDFISRLISYLISFINWLSDLLLRVYDYCITVYRELEMQEKLIVILSIVSVIIPVLPIARFYIFENWYYVNNPLAVYFIGIVIVMFISVFVQKQWMYIVRIICVVYYLIWLIYLPIGNLITKAKPYELAYGYYINITVSVLYIILCGVALVFWRR